MANTGAISWTDICNGKGMLGNATMVDRKEGAVRELSDTKECVLHEEWIIHALRAKVWRELCMEGAICISKEGPKKLNPAISHEEAIPGVVCLEEGSGGAKL